MEKQSLEAKIRYQVACEEKAHRLVIQLLEPGITEEDLVDAGLYITPEHYQDITEERGISRLCGYPVCRNQIKKVLSQKYHISTKTNTVYDITDRKNFCSNECYKASVYYKQQISTSPLWSRREETPKPIHLLAKEFNRGSMGREVIDTQTEIYREAKRYRDEVKREEREKDRSTKTGGSKHESEENAEVMALNVEKLTIQDSQKNNTSLDRGNKSGKSAEKTDYSRKSTRKAGTPVTSSVTSNDQQKEKVDRLMALLDRRRHLLGKLVQDERTVMQEKTQPTERSHSETQKRIKDEECDESCDQPHSESETPCESEAPCEDKPKGGVIKSKIKVIGESISTVSNTEKEKEMSERHRSPDRVPTRGVSYLGLVCEVMREWITPETRSFVESPDMEVERRADSGSEMELKIRNLCRRVDRQEAALDDLIGEEESLKEQLPSRSPAPNYTALKRDTEEFTHRVQDFLAAGKVIKEKAPETQTRVYLPSVDSSDQMLIRQKIVMEQLNKVIPDLLSPLKLTIQDVFAELKQLVMTLRLTSSNIVFKPAEWSLIGLVLLKLISRRSVRVSCAFLNPSALQYFSVFLGGINESLEKVDFYVTRLLQKK